MKTINISEKLSALPTISFKDLKEKFEKNTLKASKNRDVTGLKTAILQDGFFAPLYIWVEGKYIVDGSGRVLALEMLEYEGYEIPDIPFIAISAKNKREAKKHTLLASSKFGKETTDSIGEFVLDMQEMDLSYINLEGWELEDIDWTPPKAKEVDIEKMKGETKLQHKCPKCGFKFTK